jgi:hypothetical protein
MCCTGSECWVEQQGSRLQIQKTLARGMAKTKKYAWRCTATLLWIQVISAWAGLSSTFDASAASAWGFLQSFLAAIDLAPSSIDVLIPAAKLSWLLLITGLGLVDLLFFFLYCLMFPLLILIWIALKILANKAATKAAEVSPDKTSKPARFPLFKAALFSLLLWMALYGDSRTPLHWYIGVALAAILLLAAIGRACLLVIPTESRIRRYLGNFVDEVDKMVAKLKPVGVDGKVPATGFEGWLARVSRRLAIWLRGGRGALLGSVLSLANVLLQFVVLAGASIFFWALLIRANLGSASITYASLFDFVLSHFLPGVPAPSNIVDAPRWAHLGPSITFWIIFTLLLGAALSIFQTRRDALVRDVHEAYLIFRHAAVTLSRAVKRVTKTPIAPPR